MRLMSLMSWSQLRRRDGLFFASCKKASYPKLKSSLLQNRVLSTHRIQFLYWKTSRGTKLCCLGPFTWEGKRLSWLLHCSVPQPASFSVLCDGTGRVGHGLLGQGANGLSLTCVLLRKDHGRGIAEAMMQQKLVTSTKAIVAWMWVLGSAAFCHVDFGKNFFSLRRSRTLLPRFQVLRPPFSGVFPLGLPSYSRSMVA